MKFAAHATLIAALLAFAGCTSDDGYNGCHGVGCMVDNPDVRTRAIDDRPQFDRDGNPNFDTRGRYQGCHGIGCEVDNPDGDDDDQSVDDRPQFDDDGNPNFDTQGNYQGCHGVGCEVDDPDDDDVDG